MAIECYSLKLEGISTGNHMENVLHFNVDNNDDATPLALAKELCDKFVATLLTLWMGPQSNRYGLRYIEARRVLPNSGNSYWIEFPEGAEVGSVNSEQGSTSVAPIVKLFSGLSSGVQGRVFLPTPPSSDLLNNVLDSDYISDMMDFFTAALVFEGSAHDWNLAILSKKLNQGLAVSAAAIGPVIGQIGGRRRPL